MRARNLKQELLLINRQRLETKIPMTKIKLLIAIISIPFLLTAQDSDGITFDNGTWAQILAKAKELNKPVFIDCYTQWCGPCKVMAKNVFPQKNVGDYYNANFINVKLDVEKGDGPALKEKYNISFYPTLLFVDVEGKELHRRVGGLNVEAFLNLGKEVFGDKTLAGMNKKYEDGLRDHMFLVEYFNLLYSSRNNAQLKSYVDDYFRELPDTELTKEINWNFINKYVHKLTSREFQYLYNNRSEFEKLFGEKEVDKKIKSTIQRGGYQYLIEKDGVSAINQEGYEAYKKWMIDHQIENLNVIFISIDAAYALKTKKYEEYTRIMDKAMASNLLPSTASHIYQYVARCIVCKEPAVLKKADQWLDMALESMEEGDRYEANILKLKKIVAEDLKAMDGQ